MVKTIFYFSQCTNTLKELVILIFQNGNLKGCLNKIIKSLTETNNIRNSLSDYLGKIRVKSYGRCLKHDKITFNYRKTINIYMLFMRYVKIII